MVTPPVAAPPWHRLTIDERQPITSQVTEALTHLQKPNCEPLLLLSRDDRPPSHTLLQRIVSVCELIKREYPKMFLSDRALAELKRDAVEERKGFLNHPVVVPDKLSKKLYQYNRVRSHLPLDVADSMNLEDDRDPELPEELPDPGARKAHNQAIQSIVAENRKRPLKKHQPVMEIVLSPRKVTWLQSSDGWSIQTPEQGDGRKKSPGKALRAQKYRRQRAIKRKAASIGLAAATTTPAMDAEPVQP